MITRQLINFQDDQYILKYKILDDPKYTGDKLDLLIKLYEANKVLRKEDYLYFLEKIEDAQILWESNDGC
jgi:hypothetical protein